MVTTSSARAALTAVALFGAGLITPAYAWEGVCQGKSTVTPPPARSNVPGNRQCGIFLDGKFQDFVIDILENNRGCVFKKSDKFCTDTQGHKIQLNKYAVKIINAGTRTEACVADLNHPQPYQVVFTSDCKEQLKK